MLIPATRYRDPEAALAFLTGVLGLNEHRVCRDGDGRIAHDQLSPGAGIFMFDPDDDRPFGRLMVSPSETGGRETATVRAVVPDMAARHAHAAEAGAEIVMPLEAQDHGGSSFSLRDPGGHVWMLGGYDPAATA